MGLTNPMSQDNVNAMNYEIHQEHKNDDLIADANREQRRRFQRTEWLKLIAVLIGSIVALFLIMTIIGFFVHYGPVTP